MSTYRVIIAQHNRDNFLSSEIDKKSVARTLKIFFTNFGNKNRYGMDILHIIRKFRPQHCIGLKKKISKAADERVRTKTTAINLAHRIHGPSPTPDSVPIFVLHGCLASKKNWESMCNKITVSTNKTVIAVDARNHGDSPHSDAHSYSDLAADVSLLISKFSIERSIIIGHNMGGRTGMVLALTEPSKVASLIIVDTSPVSTASIITDFFPKVMNAMMAVDFRGLDLNKAKTAARNKMLETDLFQNEADMQLILTNIGKLPDKTFGWKYNLNTLKKSFDKIVAFPNMTGKTYSGPTLFVGGKLSYCIPADDLEGIHRFFPAAYLVYIEGAGHNVHAEEPNAFFDTLMQFLSYNAMIQTPI